MFCFVIDLCIKCDVIFFLVLCPVGYCVNGVCQMIGNNPHCDCPPLYTGEQCDSLIDPITAPTPITVTTPIGKIIFYTKTLS